MSLNAEAASADHGRSVLGHRVRAGENPRLVVLHSIGLDNRSWEDLEPLLPPCARLLVDLPGHGTSVHVVPPRCGVRAQARLVKALMDSLGWESAFFLGNSLGGGVALSLAVEHAEYVQGLILLNSVAFREGLPWFTRLGFVPGMERIVAAMPPRVIGVGLQVARRRWSSVTTRRVQRTAAYLKSPEGVRGFFHALRELRGEDLPWLAPRYRRIACPTLVLHGRHDPVIPTAQARRLAASIPNAEYRELPGCGHFPQEENPDLVANEVRRFLATHAAPAPGEAGEASERPDS